jgi:hypothetical protein
LNADSLVGIDFRDNSKLYRIFDQKFYGLTRASMRKFRDFLRFQIFWGFDSVDDRSGDNILGNGAADDSLHIPTAADLLDKGFSLIFTFKGVPLDINAAIEPIEGVNRPSVPVNT